MRDQTRRSMLLATLLAAVSFLAPGGALAAATCDTQVNAVTRLYATALIGKGAAACAKTPGAGCLQVTAPAKQTPSAKKLKKCQDADITRLFGGTCFSREDGCVPAQVTTTDHVAQCIKCRVDGEVKCLLAATFTNANLPPGCQVDTEGDLFAPSTAQADGR